MAEKDKKDKDNQKKDQNGGADWPTPAREPETRRRGEEPRRGPGSS